MAITATWTAPYEFVPAVLTAAQMNQYISNNLLYLKTNGLDFTTTRTANTILSGPTTGSAAAPTFRALVDADIPNHAYTKLTYSDLNAGHVLRASSATAASFAALQSTDIPAHPYTQHTYSGLTTGHVLQATGATAAGFAALSASNITTGELASARGGLPRGTAFPGSPATGDLFLRTDYTPYRIYYYTGSAWTMIVGNAGVRAYNNANISIGNGSTTAITLNSERYDTDTFHSTSVNTGRLTVPAGLAGTYLISAAVSFASNATGARAIQLWVNGGGAVIATTFVPATGGGLPTDIAVSTLYRLSAADYIELAVYQSSGGSLNLTSAGNYTPELAIQWLGA